MNAPAPDDLLCAALRQPQLLSALAPAGWDVLVRQARHADLLARIGCVLDARGSLDAVADAPRAHLRAAMRLAEAQHAEAMRELAFIDEALAPTRITPVLLGGAAYAAAGLLPAMGRMFAELDILVPKSRLAEVEAMLIAHGWDTAHHTPYDQRYHRSWLRELPPLRHITRQSVLRVRHALLPETARLKPSTAKLLIGARPLANDERFAVLTPVDMVLHGMVRLFQQEDLSHTLRDLSDLDLLLRLGSRAPGFWVELQQRARDLDLARPLHCGLRYTSALLGTPVPPASLSAAATAGPGRLLAAVNDRLWARALRPQHASAADAWTPLALFALRLRALWLHMPPGLLLRHLAAMGLRLDGPVAARPKLSQAKAAR